MKSTLIKIPAKLYEDDLLDFAKLLSIDPTVDKIQIDISNCQYHIPSAILLLFARCQEWINSNVTIEFLYSDSDYHQYCQRMNFFKLLNFVDSEAFVRRDPSDRFLPIIEFGPGSREDQEYDKGPDQLSYLLSDIAILESKANTSPQIREIKSGIVYSSGELIMNVIQHSRGTGYVFAQYSDYKDYVRIAILDNGIGIKESFRVQQSKYYYPEMTDLESIKTALKYEVSSKPIGPRFENAGVGLTYLSRIAAIAGEDMTIISNTGFLRLNFEYENKTILCPGTLSSITLKRQDLIEFSKVFRKAQTN